jgi:hypothetical protein
MAARQLGKSGPDSRAGAAFDNIALLRRDIIAKVDTCARSRSDEELRAAAASSPSLDLAKAALVAAKGKYAKHEVIDADCAPLRNLEANFAKDKSPDAVKMTRAIDVFCDIDVKLEGAVATLKGDQDKLTAASVAAGEQTSHPRAPRHELRRGLGRDAQSTELFSRSPRESSIRELESQPDYYLQMTPC